MPNIAIYPIQGNFRVFTILKSKQGCGVLPENLKRGPYAVVDERALIRVKSIFEQNFVTFCQILDLCIYEVTIYGVEVYKSRDWSPRLLRSLVDNKNLIISFTSFLSIALPWLALYLVISAISGKILIISYRTSVRNSHWNFFKVNIIS